MCNPIHTNESPGASDRLSAAAEQRSPNWMACRWEQLDGDLPQLQLPTDYPRRALQTCRHAMQPGAMPKSLSEAVEALSQQEGVTLFVTLLAAFEALLYRYTGQEEIVLGSFAARHKCPEMEKLIGLFRDAVILRTNLSGNPSFRELLRRVREVTSGIFSHPDVPFERLMKESECTRDLSRSLLPQIFFSLQSQMSEPASARTVTDRAWMKYDLYVELEDGPEGIISRFNYNAFLFDAARIGRMVGHLRTLLEGAVADPGRRISELPLLDKAEKHKVLVEFNDATANYRRDLCVQAFLEAQVQRTPAEIALVCETERLTYSELNARANRVAHYLRKRGVGPEVLVGICTERSVDMLVGILGILKAGGAYVPLDPAYPKDRLAAILEDSKAPILLTQEPLVNSLPQHAAEVVRLDADWPMIAAESQENPISDVKPENLGYVLFTSGSTGRPKGVALEHRSAATFIQWAQSVFTPEEVAGTLFSTSMCFDLSVFEMFVPLSMGGKVIMVQNALFLPGLPAANEVTLINTVPSAIAELVRMNAVPASVQVVNLAGEALPTSLAQQIYAKTAVRKVYNLYGPTEDTTYSTYTLVQTGAEVTIGRPLPNTQAYILDASRRPAPIGVPGELYLAGEGLARGYFGRPELTNERFLPNPFSREPGARMYRTGDLARFSPDGNIECLGRFDHQVKIRGFRIELGEIETVLNHHAAVSQNVVLAREDIPGDKHLVAYVVPAQRPGPTLTELRNFLKQNLPEYMLPSRFMFLEALPLTPNGKVDRRALPVPEQLELSQQRDYVAPRDAVESQLAKIWESVLSIRPIGVRDNFFQLGGHSLLVAKLLRRIEQAFGKKLSMAAIFQAPTIQQLASVVRNYSSPTPSAVLPIQGGVLPIQPAGSRPPFFCFCFDSGPVFRPLALRLGSDQPFLGLTLEMSELAKLPFPYQLEDIVGCLLRLMRELQPEGPYYVGGLCVGGLVAYEAARQLMAQGQQVALVALFEAGAPLHSNKSSQTRSRFSLLAQKLSFQLRSIRQLEIRAVPAYVRIRLDTVWQMVGTFIWHKFYNLRSRLGEYRPRDLRRTMHLAANAYRPQPYLGRVALFEANERPPGRDWDLGLGWSEFAVGDLEVHEIPGHHESILFEPNVDFLASKVSACLSEAQLEAEGHRTSCSPQGRIGRQRQQNDILYQA
jgi:amino acid adenylation domain-containing protein